MREHIIEQVIETKIVAIVRGLPVEQVVPLACALRDGGVTIMEVVFNQARPETHVKTAEAITAVRKACGESIHIGAGTVMTVQQLRLAQEAGAQFVVSPNCDAAIIQETRARGLVSMPGCMTASECAAAHSHGADFIKVFPAGSLGPGYIESISAPLNHLKFLAVGGVSIKNIPDFLRAGVCGFGIGGALADKTLAAAGRFDEITDNARRYIKAVNGGLA